MRCLDPRRIEDLVAGRLSARRAAVTERRDLGFVNASWTIRQSTRSRMRENWVANMLCVDESAMNRRAWGST